MRIGIIGSNTSSVTSEMEEFAFELGRTLIDNGHEIVNGGMGGIMKSSAKGARTSDRYQPSKVIAILPVKEPEKGNSYSGIKIVTDMGSGRNRLIVLNADAIIAIGGGTGTLNEMSLAWELKKPIAASLNTGGWASKLAGTRIDNRREDVVKGIESVEDVLDWLKTL